MTSYPRLLKDSNFLNLHRFLDLVISVKTSEYYYYYWCAVGKFVILGLFMWWTNHKNSTEFCQISPCCLACCLALSAQLEVIPRQFSRSWLGRSFQNATQWNRGISSVRKHSGIERDLCCFDKKQHRWFSHLIRTFLLLTPDFGGFPNR